MKNEFVSLSNDQLLAKTTETVKLEKFYAAHLIRYLLEVENRALHLLLGYENMFKFLTKELKYSDSEAYIRTNAIKLLRANPIVENKIAQW